MSDLFVRAPDPRVLPDGVAQYSVSFDPEEVAASPSASRDLPAPLARAVAKRRAEFLAGRFCAREALNAASPGLEDLTVAIGAEREPIWPRGFVGAITHTYRHASRGARGFASAAIARADVLRGVGLDLEPLIDDERAASVASIIASPSELAALEGPTGWTRGEVLTLVFSAKESIFKCLYPEVGRYFDFHDAEVIHIDTRADRFTARLLVDLTDALPRGASLEGRFERSETSLCTGVHRRLHAQPAPSDRDATTSAPAPGGLSR